VHASFINKDVEGASLWFDGKQQWQDGDWKIGHVSAKSANLTCGVFPHLEKTHALCASCSVPAFLPAPVWVGMSGTAVVFPW